MRLDGWGWPNLTSPQPSLGVYSHGFAAFFGGWFPRRPWLMPSPLLLCRQTPEDQKKKKTSNQWAGGYIYRPTGGAPVAVH